MIEVCENEEEIRSIIIDDPEMFERAGSDASSSEERLVDKGIWLKWVNEGCSTIKALCFLRAESSYAIEIHIHIPKQYRGKGSLDKGRDFLKWVINNNGGKFVKFNTKIPVIHRDVILYAMKAGFKREGTNRLSVIKGGVLMDQAMMGLTFEEAKLNVI